MLKGQYKMGDCIWKLLSCTEYFLLKKPIIYYRTLETDIYCRKVQEKKKKQSPHKRTSSILCVNALYLLSIPQKQKGFPHCFFFFHLWFIPETENVYTCTHIKLLTVNNSPLLLDTCTELKKGLRKTLLSFFSFSS